MKKTRFISFILLTALIAPSFNVSTVLASAQGSITNLSISRPGAFGNPHSLTLSWTPPALPVGGVAAIDRKRDGTIGNNALFETNGVAGYDITCQDLTRNIIINPPPTAQAPPAAQAAYTVDTPNTGSLYSFKITPYHYHYSWVQTGPGPDDGYDNETKHLGAASEALLMTDISVEAYGNAGSLTVTWDNPTYGAAQTQAIPKFAIYYAKTPYSGSSVKASGKGITVNAADCVRIQPTANRNNPRLTYTIVDNEIEPGFYNVAVEPCDDDGNPLRKLGDPRIMGMPATFSPDSDVDSTRYMAIGARVSLVLDYDITGKDTAMLKWADLKAFGNGGVIAIFSNNDKDRLEEQLSDYANRYESKLPEEAWPKPMATISTIDTRTYPINLADRPVYYGVVVTYNQADGTYKCIRSIVCEVSPPVVEIKPSAPYIHQQIDSNADKTVLTLYWDAFLRERAGDNDTETSTISISQPPPQRTFTYDNNVIYDLYIVDEYERLDPSYSIAPTETLNTRQAVLPVWTAKAVGHSNDASGQAVPAWAFDASFYTAADGMKRAFEKNKLYYVKLVAKKGSLSSEPVYATIYIPIDGDISSPPMLKKPPLAIRKDSEGSNVVTENSFDIKWLTEWSEVYDYSRDTALGYNPDPSDPSQNLDWHTKAAKEGAELFYGEADTKDKDDSLVSFCSILSATNVRNALGINPGDGVPVRTLNVKNCYYEIKPLLYSSFVKAIQDMRGADDTEKYRNYLEDIMAQPSGTNGWTSITPSYDTDGGPYVTISGLTPNTAYAVLLRAYRLAPDGIPSFGYANFITASTLPPSTPLDIAPETPAVTVKQSETTSTSTELRWKNVNTMEYEVVYSDVFYSDIETQYTSGIPISYEEVMKNSVLRTEGGVQYRDLAIDGLFPDAEYYFWLRAKSPTGRQSFWSNHAYTRTKGIVAPEPPRGFGLASANDLGVINQLNGTTYKRTEKNHIIMEWYKNANDPKTDGSGQSTAVAEILTHPDLTSEYIAKFGGLISNKPYYFRAKTVLTVTMGPDRKTQEEYSYVVQICAEPDFVEAAEIYVPAQPVTGDPSTFRQAESVWTKTVYFKTGTSQDDYDSDFDEDLVPLPAQDFEIVYDSTTGTLTYRFRTSGKDANGNYDNRVDQRFISNLVKGNVHNYNIDVTKYQDAPILKRVVELPYTLLKTFDERKINFGVRAGDVTLTLPPGTMETSLVKSVPDYGDNAKLHVVFNENPQNKPQLNIGDTYAMTPQEVSLYLWTPTQYVKMPYAGKPLEVKLTLNNRYDLLDSNIGSYVKNEQSAGWSRVQSEYLKETGQMKFNSHPGIYAAIERKAPGIVSFDQSATSMLNIASKLSFTDMSSYNGSALATSNQIINVMDAIINGKASLQINKVPDAATVTTLQRAGMNISAGAATVSREQAIAAMVALYEKKTGQRIRPTYTLANTPYSDTSGAQAAYQTAMLKAAEIDMLNAGSAGASLRPKANITLGEMLELADVVISDAGL